MATTLSAGQVEQLRRTAKKLARQRAVPHSEALDRVAAQHGFKNWSLLARQAATASGAREARQGARVGVGDTFQRFYLHGDQAEDDRSAFYCSHCDVFFDIAHFKGPEAPHADDGLARFRAALARWQNLPAAKKGAWRRPAAAFNVLLE
jgi:hypothetical protein